MVHSKTVKLLLAFMHKCIFSIDMFLNEWFFANDILPHLFSVEKFAWKYGEFQWFNEWKTTPKITTDFLWKIMWLSSFLICLQSTRDKLEFSNIFETHLNDANNDWKPWKLQSYFSHIFTSKNIFNLLTQMKLIKMDEILNSIPISAVT